MNIWYVAVAFAIAPWLAFGVMTYTAPPPIEELPGSFVEPLIVAPQGSFTVTRNLRVNAEKPVRVSRSLIKGDCRKVCDVIDITGGNLTLTKGDHPGVRRAHFLPTSIPAGTWRLVFALHWDDAIGREHRLLLQELTIEVVR